MDGAEHLVEVEFGHRFLELLLRLDFIEELAPLHPDTRIAELSVRMKAHTHTHTQSVQRHSHLEDDEVTVLCLVEVLRLY